MGIYPGWNISIHVPREGDDHQPAALKLGLGISIHVPREGDDPDTAPPIVWVVAFQSTSPVRGTTFAAVP